MEFHHQATHTRFARNSKCMSVSCLHRGRLRIPDAGKVHDRRQSTCGMRRERRHKVFACSLATGPGLLRRNEKHRGVTQRTRGHSRKRLGDVAQEAREWCNKSVTHAANHGVTRFENPQHCLVKPPHDDGTSRRYYRANPGKHFDSNARYSRRTSTQRLHAQGSRTVQNASEHRRPVYPA